MGQEMHQGTLPPACRFRWRGRLASGAQPAFSRRLDHFLVVRPEQGSLRRRAVVDGVVHEVEFEDRLHNAIDVGVAAT